MNAFTHFALATAYLLLFYVKHNSFSLVMKQALTVGHHRQFFQIGALHTSYCRPSCKWLSSGHICYRTFICTGSVSTFFVCTIPTSSLQPPNILNVCLSSALSRRGYHRHDNIQLTPFQLLPESESTIVSNPPGYLSITRYGYEITNHQV